MQLGSLKIKRLELIIRVIQYLPKYTIHRENGELQLFLHFLACCLAHTSLTTIPDSCMEC